MTTKAQQLKKELTQAFPELKFSVQTSKGVTNKISVNVKGLMGSLYTMPEIQVITNKYHNYSLDWFNDAYTGDTVVNVTNDDLDVMFDEIKAMLNINDEIYYPGIYDDLYKVANNEFFSVLPDGYYEKKMTEIEQSINEPIEYKIESIAFNGSVFNSAECDWGQSKTVDLISQYHEYLQDKLSRKEYDTIITLESFKDKLASMPVKFISP